MPEREISNLLTKFTHAIEHLLFGKGILRWRLCDAYRDYLCYLQPRDFPSDELRKTFEEIQAAMSAYTLGDALDAKHGRIKAAMHLMPGTRARSVSKKVFRIYTGLVDMAIYGKDGAGLSAESVRRA